MKVLFVYPGYIVREVPLNVMYVSAAIRAAGHESRLFHFSQFKRQRWLRENAEIIEENFVKTMNSFKPDAVGFSVMIMDYKVTKRLSWLVKNRYKIPVVWGGIEPILESERCVAEPEVDYVCTGEGEYVFPELLEKIKSGGDPFTIAGVWGKNSSGKVVRTGRPDLIDDLDSIPFPDRDLLEPEYYKAELTGANVLTARGCPFPCAFCQNKELMNIYKGKGKFTRYRNLEYVMKEMEELISKYNVQSFYISDEMFSLNKRRALDFCAEYKKKINKPFMIQTRVDYMDDHLARVLSDAGCFMVNMAIESGNEHIRNSIFKKGISFDAIVNAYKTVRDHGMMSSSFNMIGVPGETVSTIKDTIEVNRKLKPNRILCSIFMPLPGTELGEYCKKNDLIKGAIQDSTNYYSQVAIKNPNISARTLIGYQGFFDWYVLLPKWSQSFVHFLRLIYQNIIPVEIPNHQVLRKMREMIIETVYQSKKYLPQKTFHVKNR